MSKNKLEIHFMNFVLLNLDISECQAETLASEHSHYSHNCHDDANCTNTKGSFYCTCHHGYSGDGVICVGDWHYLINTFVKYILSASEI